ncbi:hypothetical protein CONPUDRAFT_165355 [Coniophora puteana RWD-64-598 SS2]|uniref:Uncharacterized protein n=1 Tax=Coniophora puteana (strain RWD-64-598) TaxID=741705 RepID=A0A5M3MPP0_CONPW|nr:uncharacterized protein CONPUDRAFT_165355 [Coniophora puteana RWD-64-598 SS2]EIW81138.1 hypothetical protein CONPUDRAFT_165355 [Coniophora puteana RWD-64-598 SS2]
MPQRSGGEQSDCSYDIVLWDGDVPCAVPAPTHGRGHGPSAGGAADPSRQGARTRRPPPAPATVMQMVDDDFDAVTYPDTAFPAYSTWEAEAEAEDGRCPVYREGVLQDVHDGPQMSAMRCESGCDGCGRGGGAGYGQGQESERCYEARSNGCDDGSGRGSGKGDRVRDDGYGGRGVQALRPGMLSRTDSRRTDGESGRQREREIEHTMANMNMRGEPYAPSEQGVSAVSEVRSPRMKASEGKAGSGSSAGGPGGTTKKGKTVTDWREEVARRAVANGHSLARTPQHSEGAPSVSAGASSSSEARARVRRIPPPDAYPPAQAYMSRSERMYTHSELNITIPGGGGGGGLLDPISTSTPKASQHPPSQSQPQQQPQQQAPSQQTPPRHRGPGQGDYDRTRDRSREREERAEHERQERRARRRERERMRERESSPARSEHIYTLAELNALSNDEYIAQLHERARSRQAQAQAQAPEPVERGAESPDAVAGATQSQRERERESQGSRSRGQSNSPRSSPNSRPRGGSGSASSPRSPLQTHSHSHSHTQSQLHSHSHSLSHSEGIPTPPAPSAYVSRFLTTHCTPPLTHLAPVLGALGVAGETHMRAMARLSEETRDREVKAEMLRRGATVLEWAVFVDALRGLA